MFANIPKQSGTRLALTPIVGRKLLIPIQTQEATGK